MRYRLKFRVIEKNYGSQYHNFMLGLLPDDEYIEKYLLKYYIPLSVKHFTESHGDYYNEGIYGYNGRYINQLIIRGPVDNLHEVIREYIKNGIYVILNINEGLLPHRRAYREYYFRHDIIIYGFDDEKDTYITAGFNEEMIFCEYEYPANILETAYKGMENEWDYELFAIKACDLMPSISIEPDNIYNDLKEYVEGINPGDKRRKDIYKGDKYQYFINYSYKNYYGIGLYDYLEERINGSKKIFGKTSDNDRIGVNDIRTINVLITHAEILNNAFKILLQDEEDYGWEDVINATGYLKIMLIQYLENNSLKYKNKIIKHIKSIKIKQTELIWKILRKYNTESV